MVERRDNSRPRRATIKIAERCAQLCRRTIFSLISFSLFTNIIQLVRQFALARERSTNGDPRSNQAHDDFIVVESLNHRSDASALVLSADDI